jgi:hypothetical protein
MRLESVLQMACPRPARLPFGLNLPVALCGLAAPPPKGTRPAIVTPRPFVAVAAAIVAQAQGVIVRNGMAGALLARAERAGL